MTLGLGDSVPGIITFQKNLGLDPNYPNAAVPQNVTTLNAAGNFVNYDSTISGINYYLPAFANTNTTDQYIVAVDNPTTGPVPSGYIIQWNGTSFVLVPGGGGGSINYSFTNAGDVLVCVDSTHISGSPYINMDGIGNIVIKNTPMAGGIDIGDANCEALNLTAGTGAITISTQNSQNITVGSANVLSLSDGSSDLIELNNGITVVAGGTNGININANNGTTLITNNNVTDVIVNGPGNAIQIDSNGGNVTINANLNDNIDLTAAASITLITNNDAINLISAGAVNLSSLGAAGAGIFMDNNNGGGWPINIGSSGAGTNQITLQTNAGDTLELANAINLNTNGEFEVLSAGGMLLADSSIYSLSITSNTDIFAQSQGTVRLYANSSVYINALNGSNYPCVFQNGGGEVSYVDNSGNYITVSKREYKDDIVDMETNVLEKLCKLKPKKYILKCDKSKRQQAGFILDEVNDFDTIKFEQGINYAGLVPYIVKAIQELVGSNSEDFKAGPLVDGLESQIKKQSILIEDLKIQSLKQNEYIQSVVKDLDILKNKFSLLTKKFIKKGGKKNNDATKSMAIEEDDFEEL